MTALIYTSLLSTSIINFMIPLSIDFEIFIQPDEYNFGTLGCHDALGGEGVTQKKLALPSTI